jgi:hypothetical protein
LQGHRHHAGRYSAKPTQPDPGGLQPPPEDGPDPSTAGHRVSAGTVRAGQTMKFSEQGAKPLLCRTKELSSVFRQSGDNGWYGQAGPILLR